MRQQLGYKSCGSAEQVLGTSVVWQDVCECIINKAGTCMKS